MNFKTPSIKNCRIDYKYISGITFSVLVDYMNEDRILYYKTGARSLKEVYAEFKFMLKESNISNESPLTIDNAPYLPFTLYKIEGLKYQY